MDDDEFGSFASAYDTKLSSTTLTTNFQSQYATPPTFVNNKNGNFTAFDGNSLNGGGSHANISHSRLPSTLADQSWNIASGVAAQSKNNDFSKQFQSIDDAINNAFKKSSADLKISSNSTTTCKNFDDFKFSPQINQSSDQKQVTNASSHAANWNLLLESDVSLSSLFSTPPPSSAAIDVIPPNTIETPKFTSLKQAGYTSVSPIQSDNEDNENSKSHSRAVNSFKLSQNQSIIETSADSKESTKTVREEKNDNNDEDDDWAEFTGSNQIIISDQPSLSSPPAQQKSEWFPPPQKSTLTSAEPQQHSLTKESPSASKPYCDPLQAGRSIPNEFQQKRQKQQQQQHYVIEPEKLARIKDEVLPESTEKHEHYEAVCEMLRREFEMDAAIAGDADCSRSSSNAGARDDDYDDDDQYDDEVCADFEHQDKEVAKKNANNERDVEKEAATTKVCPPISLEQFEKNIVSNLSRKISQSQPVNHTEIERQEREESEEEANWGEFVDSSKPVDDAIQCKNTNNNDGDVDVNEDKYAAFQELSSNSHSHTHTNTAPLTSSAENNQSDLKRQSERQKKLQSVKLLFEAAQKVCYNAMNSPDWSAITRFDEAARQDLIDSEKFQRFIQNINVLRDILIRCAHRLVLGDHPSERDDDVTSTFLDAAELSDLIGAWSSIAQSLRTKTNETVLQPMTRQHFVPPPLKQTAQHTKQKLQQHQHRDDCAICMTSDPPPNTAFGPRLYHSSCANLWLHNIDSVLPT